MMEPLIALGALTAMEIVLGIDNIVVIALVTGRLPMEQRARARSVGLALAMGTRVLLLLFLSSMLQLTGPLFELSQLGIATEWLTSKEHHEVNQVSIRDCILLGGGLFLIWKSVKEIHKKIEGDEHGPEGTQVTSFKAAIFEILIMDIIFSLDSVITAVGMVKPDHLWVMITSIILAVIVMLIFSGYISNFIERHPTLKMLALSFLILIGVMLTAEGVGTKIDKGYIYFAMAFAVVMEMLNMKVRKHATGTSKNH